MSYLNTLTVYALEQAFMLDAMAVPDFVAGFVFGMTGDNHLTEIEACYQGGTDVVSDVQKAVTKIESGSYIAGFAEIGLIINEFPSTLTTCKSMDDDIAAIESWATIFTEPEVLAKTLSKNWLLHRRTIKEELAQESTDWATGEYFNAGVDTAKALTEAVGPIQTTTNEISTPENLDLLMVPELVAGFIYGVTGDLKLQEVETCVQSAESLGKYLENMKDDLLEFHFLKAIAQLQLFLFHLQKTLEPCHDLDADLQTIEAWASIFKHPEELGETVTYNAIMNRKTLKDMASKEGEDWSTGAWFDAGDDMANMAVLLIGPAPTEAVPAKNYGLTLDPHMVNYMLAGFIYGMTTQNHLTEIEACYAGGAEMDHELMAAIGDFKAGGWNNITQGVLEVLLIAFQMPQELHTCKNMQDDIQAITSWASVFTNKTELISTVTKHYLFHKKEVQGDIATLKSDYSGDEYFKAGEDLAELATVLIGPMH